MCDPLTIASMAVSAGTTMYQNQQQAKNMARMAEARNSATEDNFRRQDVLRSESKQQFGDVLNKFSPGEQAGREAAAGTRRASLTEAAIPQNNPYAGVSTRAPSIVQNEVKRQVGEAGMRAGQQAGAGAKLASFGDVLLNNNIDLGRAQGQIRQTSDFSRGVAHLLPLEQNAAMNNAYKAPGGLSNLVKLAATGGTLAGAAGLGPTWGDLFGSNPWLTPNNSAINTISRTV